MNRRIKSAMIFATVAMAVPQGVSAAGPNAKLWNGTWHLNPATSKFQSTAKEQSETRTYDISGGKVTMKSSSKDAAGKELNFNYSAAWDGKTYPMAGNPNAGSISLTAVSATPFRAKSPLQGQPTRPST